MAVRKSTLALFATVVLSILCSHLGSGLRLEFERSPSVIKPLETTNVTLKCIVQSRTYYQRGQREYRYHDMFNSRASSGNSNKNVARLRILKKTEHGWNGIAEVTSVNPTQVVLSDSSIAAGTGVLSTDQITRSNLQISWELATVDTFGTYRCDVWNLDENQHVQVVESSETEYGNDLKAQDFLHLITHEREKLRLVLEKQQQDQLQLQSLVRNLMAKLADMEESSREEKARIEADLEHIIANFTAEEKALKESILGIEKSVEEFDKESSHKIDVLFKSGFLALWPTGSYGLLEPESGCPAGGKYLWEEGIITHHTESTDRNHDRSSKGIHVKLPLLTRHDAKNFVIQHFCMKPDPKTAGPVWPKGKFCILKKGDCPVGFEQGYLQWDEENTGHSGNRSGVLPDGNYDENTLIYFCCRRDGQADVPIFLPPARPFYLFRYGGTCQKVHEMKVSSEFLQFDTENTNNTDMRDGISPDSQLRNIRLELCYYTK